MSQDLFAAFGEEDTTQVWSDEPVAQYTSAVSSDGLQRLRAMDDAPGWGQQNFTQTNAPPDDDDEFGDFEDASAPKAANIGFNQGMYAIESTTTETTKPPSNEHTPSLPKAFSKQSLKASSPQLQEKQESTGHHPFAGRMDLLFEASDDEYDAGADELGDLSTNPEAAMAYSKRIIAEQEAAQWRGNESSSLRQTSSRSAQEPDTTAQPGPNKLRSYTPAKDPNVLFDADDISEEDDDFDDFESGNESIAEGNISAESTQAQSRGAMPPIDLLGTDDSPQPISTTYANGEPSRSQRMATIVNQQPNWQIKTSITQAGQEDDAWDDFETAAPSNRSSGPEQLSSPSPISKSRVDPTETLSKEQNTLPPTNIPPPAIILSVFPSLFAEADDALFNAIGKLDLKQKHMLLAHPASHQFLKGYLGHCTVLARIIAGRKLRWKRDQRLSQSMRISPAAAGGKGGMKLTGLDKTEVAKEDREAVDVLRLWKTQVGKLRTAVTAASAAPAVPKLPLVPEIAEQMPVKSLKPFEGGISAPQPCALCGLKREERVAKVDVEVEDNFGEWWIQGINMHLSCRNFWDEFERKLKSR